MYGFATPASTGGRRYLTKLWRHLLRSFLEWTDPKYGPFQAMAGSPRCCRQAQVTAVLHVVWYHGFELHCAQNIPCRNMYSSLGSGRRWLLIFFLSPHLQILRSTFF